MKYVDGYFAHDLTDPGSELGAFVILEYEQARSQGTDRRIILTDCNNRQRVAELVAWSEQSFGRILPIISRTVSEAEMVKVLRGTEHPITPENVMRCLDGVGA